MSKHVRRKVAEEIRWRKRLRLCLKRIVSVLPLGFSNDDLVSLFKATYPTMWIELENKFKSDKMLYSARIAKGLKGVKPTVPSRFVLNAVSHTIEGIRNSQAEFNVIQEREKQTERERLITKGKTKLAKLKATEVERQRKIQKVEPSYVGDLIKEYFKLRRKDTLDVNSRYLIILECAKFKCKRSISFLEKLNACEKNDELRQLAYESLCRFGLAPRLAHKRKGKKKQSSIKTKDLDENPTELLQRIYENQHKIHKHFDVFLSHSYGRQTELLEVKEILNKQGLIVYVDWINDAEMMSREKQNNDTFNVLYERLRQSSSLLFIQTKQSVDSEYCSDEIAFFKELNRPMYILEHEPIEEQSSFYNDLTLVKQADGRIFVEKDSEEFILSKRLIAESSTV